ncbi:MAG: hypothetical protein Q8M92_00695 [Candidatus Subteraquimicrobiales bacterium]|nr:hypothetical protein [Candidatus Subteraquimicrobiales bacterium]
MFKDYDKPLFHGSRAKFKFFDNKFINTGERAGLRIGFEFTDSLKGAANHARDKARSKGEPVVYICKFKKGTKVLKRQVPITSHDDFILDHWNKILPITCQKIKNEKEWFGDLYKYVLSIKFSNEIENDTCKFLLESGFDAIDNFECGWQDGYLHGNVILVMNCEQIEIIESFLVIDIGAEITSDDHKKYFFSETKAPLGETGLMSYLRPFEITK